MSLLGSIYLGTSGVKTQTQAMRMAADNLANLHTTGFKGARGLFEEVLLEVSGKVWPSQRGLGTRLKDLDLDFSPGTVVNTDLATDLAIRGRGFFVVQDPVGEKTFFTRDGQFLLEDTGNNTLRMVSPLGYSLLGGEVRAEPNEIRELSPLEIPKLLSGKATETVHLEMNLEAERPPEIQSVSLLESWEATNPEGPLSPQAYAFVTTVKVYDPLGVDHNLNLYFDTTAQDHQYEVLVTLADPLEDWRGSGPYAGALLWGTLDFGARGEVIGAEFYTLEEVNPQNGTARLNPIDLTATGRPQFTLNFTGTPQTVTLDLGFYFDERGNLVRTSRSVHAYGAPFTVYHQNQDGYPPGIFERVEINAEGLVRAYYTNQQTQEIARIFLADFTGLEDSLVRAGGNLFKALPGARPQIFAPGISERGILKSGALEGSNVDLAEEMVELITLQRAFQSNVRVITTADQMLEDFLRAR